ncbi:MAG: hypothetical protein WC647_07725 [Desulfomonilaceae bacterium]
MIIVAATRSLEMTTATHGAAMGSRMLGHRGRAAIGEWVQELSDLPPLQGAVHEPTVLPWEIFGKGPPSLLDANERPFERRSIPRPSAGAGIRRPFRAS